MYVCMYVHNAKGLLDENRITNWKLTVLRKFLCTYAVPGAQHELERGIGGDVLVDPNLGVDPLEILPHKPDFPRPLRGCQQRGKEARDQWQARHRTCRRGRPMPPPALWALRP